MTGVHRYLMPRAAMTLVAMASAVSLVGCALDTETRVRQELGAWVSLGDTVFFDSRMDCTAALFETRAVAPRAAVAMVRTLPDGMRMIGAGETVGFDVPGHSPDGVSQALMSADLPEGLGLLSSGVSGRACMSEPVRQAYLAALTDPGAILVYAPSTNALAVLDVLHGQVFFARGDV